jgi:hypothetical protein
VLVAVGLAVPLARIPIAVVLLCAWNSHNLVFWADDPPVSVKQYVLTTPHNGRVPHVADAEPIVSTVAIHKTRAVPLQETFRAHNVTAVVPLVNELFLKTVPFLLNYHRALDSIRTTADWVIVYEDDAVLDRSVDFIKTFLSKTTADVVLMSSINLAIPICNLFGRTLYGVQGAAFRTAALGAVQRALFVGNPRILEATSVQFPWSAVSNVTRIEAYPDTVLSRLCFDLGALRCACLPVVHEHA